MKKRILIVEDDSKLVQILRDNFAFEGYEVTSTTDGREALALAQDTSPDVILLDVMLPGTNGFQICESLRRRSQTPILMVTARTLKTDKLKGLNSGADDYITKPFDIDEVLARVRAVLRRTRPQSNVLTFGPVKIDLVAYTAKRGQQDLGLTHRDFEILKYLSERPEVVVHRDELLRELWGQSDSPFNRTVDNAISRLRKKIEPDVNHPRFIHTVRGDGYMWIPEGGESTSA